MENVSIDTQLNELLGLDLSKKYSLKKTHDQIILGNLHPLRNVPIINAELSR